MRALLGVLCLMLALPVLGVLGAWFALDAAALDILSHQAGTVLPGYVLQTAALAVGVGLGVMLLGTACAAAVSLFDFAGRRRRRRVAGTVRKMSCTSSSTTSCAPKCMRR